jgi:hypothetical protein
MFWGLNVLAVFVTKWCPHYLRDAAVSLLYYASPVHEVLEGINVIE